MAKRFLFPKWPRGTYGDWRGRIYLPMFARAGFFDGKVIAPNYLYYAVLNQLDELAAASNAILLMTGYGAVQAALQSRYPDKPMSLIRVGDRADPRRTKSRSPYFLAECFAALPTDLTVILCLVSGGPWSLMYCTWLKQRGGVAIDLGSGFDLLAGEVSRPTHRRVATEKIAAYAVTSPTEQDDRGAPPG